MNCPTCGAEYSYGLRYCKRCGESLSVPTNDLDRQSNQSGSSIKRVKQTEHGWDIEEIEPPGINIKKLTGMFWAVAVFGFISFAALFGSAIPMVIFGADKRMLIPMFMFGSAGIVMVAWLLIQQLSRFVGMIERSYKAPRQTQDRTNQERANQERANQERPQIDAPPRAVSSVTEHTTRNFDKIYKDPGARA
jgi:hypothetical protein